MAEAAKIVKRGGVVAYPTEYCFGLGCDPRNLRGVRRILKIKGRSFTKGLILIAEHMSKLRVYVKYLPEENRNEIFESWPGPFTWLLPAKFSVSRLVRGNSERVAVRITAHSQARALCRAAGMAIISTSANRSSYLPLRSIENVHREFGDQIDGIMAGRVGNGRRPSVIRDGFTGVTFRG